MPEEKRFLACRGPTRVAPKSLILIYKVLIFVEDIPLQIDLDTAQIPPAEPTNMVAYLMS